MSFTHNQHQGICNATCFPKFHIDSSTWYACGPMRVIRLFPPTQKAVGNGARQQLRHFLTDMMIIRGPAEWLGSRWKSRMTRMGPKYITCRGVNVESRKTCCIIYLLLLILWETHLYHAILFLIVLKTSHPLLFVVSYFSLLISSGLWEDSEGTLRSGYEASSWGATSRSSQFLLM